MSTPKMLDLDSFVTEKSLKLFSKERKVRSMTVGDFVNSAGYEEKFLAEKDPKARVQMLCERIIEFVEDTTIEELMLIEQAQLFTILSFIRGDDVKDESTPKNA